jgi:hypothetical protein
MLEETLLQTALFADEKLQEAERKIPCIVHFRGGQSCVADRVC